ncbi:hypothetical protein A0H81_12944 [Grifola frondosa]|uniref:Sugar phosphate transporter domain-containing protein n=1 Tax=Grifola frondosa TaxID=5627 RepID=A0A1C7LSG3_GRIFR|nr:hypothetical protein A0H81_12944 [Grifola frondosa]
MVISEFYIIQRAGVVPMSIAGIAKEVTTIISAAWFFGDELTPLNITGVAITACGIALYTYHKYRKSMEANVPLDSHGNPLTVDEDMAIDSMAMANGHLVDSEETEALILDPNRRESHESQPTSPSSQDARELLFDVGNEDGEEHLRERLGGGEGFDSPVPSYTEDLLRNAQKAWVDDNL